MFFAPSFRVSSTAHIMEVKEREDVLHNHSTASTTTSPTSASSDLDPVDNEEMMHNDFEEQLDLRRVNSAKRIADGYIKATHWERLTTRRQLDSSTTPPPQHNTPPHHPRSHTTRAQQPPHCLRLVPQVQGISQTPLGKGVPHITADGFD